MGVIDSLNETSNKAIDVGEVYYKKTQEYYRLKVFQQLTMTTGMLLKMAVIGGLAFLALIFITVAGVVFLANILNSMVGACLIAGALFIVLLVLAYVFRRKIDNMLVRKLSDKFFN
ncbi:MULTISPECIES: phage holin family protein [Maribacter]|uniref:phage holin family protein n=1 Tax=Maribacter TaxID=252356 RepID=UPI00047DE372|nr:MULTISPECIES: phage holin family protein [Maribacter]|tara:strand:- start:263 stop:610 length:348 start_codon:yes stop_codon:yes gene_type:complete